MIQATLDYPIFCNLLFFYSTMAFLKYSKLYIRLDQNLKKNSLEYWRYCAQFRTLITNKQIINNLVGFGSIEAQSSLIEVVNIDTVHTHDGSRLSDQDDVDALTTLLKKIVNELSVPNKQPVNARTRIVNNRDWKVYNEQLFNVLLLLLLLLLLL
jgi:hypothetical protein